MEVLSVEIPVSGWIKGQKRGWHGDVLLDGAFAWDEAEVEVASLFW